MDSNLMNTEMQKLESKYIFPSKSLPNSNYI
jgi:hypothetical protein